MTKRKQYHKSLTDFPATELWRLFIDGQRQKEGKWAFDKQVGAKDGYLAAMTNSFDKILTTLDTPLSTDELNRIHQYSMGQANPTAEQFRLGDTDFQLVADNTSIEGIMELFAWQEDPQTPPVELQYLDNNRHYRSFVPDTQKTPFENATQFHALLSTQGAKLIAKGDAQQFVTTIIEDYQREINHAKTPEAKLVAISKCVVRLERLHPFEGGNYRTMVMVTNKLLLQNGFYPCIFENAQRMSMFSINEITNEIAKGQLAFTTITVTEAIAKIEELKLYGFSDQNIQEQMRQRAMLEVQDSLSADPLVALAQLDLLYTKVINKKIHLKTKDPNDSSFAPKHLFSQHDDKRNNNDIVLNALQMLYKQNLLKFEDEIEQAQERVKDLLTRQNALYKKIDDILFQFSRMRSGHITAQETTKLVQDKEYLKKALGVLQGKLQNVSKELSRAKKAELWTKEVLVAMEQAHARIIQDISQPPVHTKMVFDAVKEKTNKTVIPKRLFP
jgi:hypothetical protein